MCAQVPWRHTQGSTAALFIRASHWKQCKFSNQISHINSIEYYIAMNVTELKLHIKIWMHFKNKALNKNLDIKEPQSPFI